MKFIAIFLSLIPVPFLFHLYEYNNHLLSQRANYLGVGFILFIVIVGLLSRKLKLKSFFIVNFIMVITSLILGNFFIDDDGSWFKPFGRDVAIIFIFFIYILGQLTVRGIIKSVISDTYHEK